MGPGQDTNEGGDRLVRPAQAARAAIAETHTAVVVFVGDRALKVKKPVTLGFVDLSTPDLRAEACRREVELNRRLAPDVYLGVAELHTPDGGVEPMVVMRRMPDETRLSALIASGADVSGHLRAIARAVAELHRGSDPTPKGDATATVEAVRGRWTDSFDELRPHLGTLLDRARSDHLEHLVHTFLDGRTPLFESRIESGCIRDGHGDLLAEDVFCLPDGPRILDCLEFDDDLRIADVAADIGFLVMDLERLGHPELGRELLDAYEEVAPFRTSRPLLEHYLAYRAHVRCKVRCLAATQGDLDGRADAAELLDLALLHMQRCGPRMVVVGGLPGTGKTTLARSLGATLGATVLRTDEIRAEVDLAHDQRAPHRPDGGNGYGTGRYAPANVEAAYRALLERAEQLLGMGESVVLDASWSSARRRVLTRDLAARTTSAMTELECRCPSALAARRLRTRVGDASEADEQVAEVMARRFEPWPEAVPIASTGPPDQALASALRVVDDSAHRAVA